MDIANIGFKVDTSDLDKAKQKLNALTPAAAGVTAASQKVAAAVEGANASIANAATAVAASEARKADAVLKGLRANSAATKEEIAAAREIKKRADANLAAARAAEKDISALNRQAVALRKVQQAAKATAVEQNALNLASNRPSPRVSNVVNGGRIETPRDQMPNRFNTANIAAQFQDIGVTAQMGMSPMIIAMQQGTQLSAIIQSMESPLKGIATAFRSIISPLTLLTIGLVGLVAAGIQMVNWTKVAQTVLNGLADVIEAALPYVLGLAAAMALLYSRTIITGLAAIVVSIYQVGAAAAVTGARMLAAWIVGMGPVAWIIAGVVAVGAAFQALGVDIIGYISTAINYIVGSFVGAFNSIKATWKMFPAVIGDLVVQAVNIYLKQIEALINGTLDAINGLVDALPPGLKKKIFGEDGAITWRANLQIDNPWKGKASEAGAMAGKEFKKAFEQDYVGDAAKWAQGVASGLASGIRDFAGGLGKDTDGKKKKGPKTDAEKFDDVVNGAERRLATLKAEQEAIGMTEVATAKLKYETDLLNDAKQKNIKLTPEMRDKLKELANDMANTEEKTRRMKEAYDFLKGAASGFFQDIKSGLAEGKTLWESFGNAVTNVIDKIMNKFLESGVDELFDGLFGKGGAGSGILKDLGNYLFSAKGNAFTQSGLQPFAKGGMFTNSIVSSPTLFKFASGGGFGKGVMGEAGPEAVMPLHRGPDGSLGVRMAGGGAGGGQQIILNVNNYSSAKTSVSQRQTGQGMEIDVMIDDVVGEKMAQPGSSSSRALDARDNRRLISR